MTDPSRPLTANSTIGDWLDHPDGGPALGELLAAGGADPSMLAPIRGLPLQRMVELSQGKMPQPVIDALVLRVNGGVAPTVAEDGGAWKETVTAGRFAGRTVIVTGAASGIGRATASRIVREGGRVIGVDITADRLKETEAELGESFVAVAADITEADGIARIVAAAGDRIDGLANVAGVVDDFSPVHETSDAVWEKLFAVNVDGVFRLTRAVVPSMLSAGRGSIVNVASEAALRGNAAGVAYTASKHAVIGITKNTAFMYGQKGIRTNAVAPGGVATGMVPTDQSEFGRGRTGPFLQLIPGVALAEHLAASITFLLSDDGVNLNGVVLPSDGGWSVQ